MTAVQKRTGGGSMKADPAAIGPEATPERASVSSDRRAQKEGAPRRRDHGDAARRADRSTAWLAGQRREVAKIARASRKKPGASPSSAGWVLQVLPEAVEALSGLLRPTEPLPRH